MVAAAVALSRLRTRCDARRAEIEARLSLGATWRQAIDPILRRSLTAGMINIVDSTKTAGLVFIPGTTVGMLLGGAAPLDAIRLQLVLFYLLVGGDGDRRRARRYARRRGFFTPGPPTKRPGGRLTTSTARRRSAAAAPTSSSRPEPVPRETDRGAARPRALRRRTTS